MDRLVSRGTGGKVKSASGAKLAPVLSGLLLVAPAFGTGCAAERGALQEARAEVTCQQSEKTLELGGLDVTVSGHCDEDGVSKVDVRMPCGSRRFQESCTLTLPVPGTATLKRGREFIPVEISAIGNRGTPSVVVEIKRKTL
jgi:hypothetical protein